MGGPKVARLHCLVGLALGFEEGRAVRAKHVEPVIEYAQFLLLDPLVLLAKSRHPRSCFRAYGELPECIDVPLDNWLHHPRGPLVGVNVLAKCRG